MGTAYNILRDGTIERVPGTRSYYDDKKPFGTRAGATAELLDGLGREQRSPAEIVREHRRQLAGSHS